MKTYQWPSVFLSVALSVLLCVLLCSPIWASGSYEEAEEKAAEIHKQASSDVIFTQDELKALYYQNLQIISLLKEMNGLLREIREESKEEGD